MKILYVSTVSSTINAFLIPHIEMLVKEGCQVDVAFKINKPLKKELVDLVTNIYEVNFSRSPFSNNPYKLIKKMREIIIEGNYEIVHTHTPIASAIVRIACKDIESVKVIYTAHGFHFYKGAPIKNWLTFYPVEKKLAEYTDTLITINEEDYKRAQNFKSRQVEYVPGVGIDFKKIQVNKKNIVKIKTDIGITSKDFILFSIGELNNNKNHQIVLESLTMIGDENIKYFVAGSGKLKEDLTKKVKELKLEDRVVFLGYRKDIYDLLEISDVFIFPSYREGLSKSLMEAMAMGKPIIASDIRGNRDLIDDNKGGYLFDPSNSTELAMLIKKMRNNEKVRESMCEYNKKKIINFSLENVLGRMREVYTNHLM